MSETSRYDVKSKQNIGALRKYYMVDNGLRKARLNFAYTDEGQMLENMVDNELLYNGYSVNVEAFERVEKDSSSKSIKKNYEIDFVAKKGNRQYYIQVSSDISNVEKKRSKTIYRVKWSNKKVIVINKPLNETLDEYDFTVIGISDFL